MDGAETRMGRRSAIAATHVRPRCHRAFATLNNTVTTVL